MEIDPRRLEYAKAIIDGLRGTLPDNLDIPHVQLCGTNLILEVITRNPDTTPNPEQCHAEILEITECLEYAAKALHDNAQQPKPIPIKKVSSLVKPTLKALRALKDAARQGMRVDYVYGDEVVPLPTPDPTDFTDVVEAAPLTRQIKKRIRGFFAGDSTGQHMLVLEDRTFIQVPLELSEVCRFAQSNLTFRAQVSRTSSQDEWRAEGEYQIDGDLFISDVS